MSEKSAPSIPLSSEELNKFILFLNDNSHNMLDPCLGNEIEFMERNGFDIALLSGWIRGAVNDFESPLRLDGLDGEYDPCGRDEEYIRMIGLQLRDYYREKWKLPPLTGQEKADWMLPTKVLKNLNKGKTQKPEGWRKPLDTVELNEKQIMAAVQYMRDNYMEIVRYSQAVLALAECQGYSGSDEIGKTRIFGAYISDSIRAVSTIEYYQMVGASSVFEVQDRVNQLKISEKH